MNIIDLFSGAGGLTEGFIRSGFNIIAHVEKDKWACETLKTRIIYHELAKASKIRLYWDYCVNSDGKNIEKDRETYIYQHCPGLKGKIDNSVLNVTFGDPSITTALIIDKIRNNLKNCGQDKIDLIIGGPPCQAYSLAGRGRMKEKAAKDDRNFLFRYYKEIVCNFKPKMFIMENVQGILTAHNGEILNAIRNEFKEIGYSFVTGLTEDKRNVINAADYGVPQNRKRMLMIGFNKDIVNESEYKDFYLELEKYRNLDNPVDTRSAIGDLPELDIKEGSNHWFGMYPKEITCMNNSSEYQILMRRDSEGIMNHYARFQNLNDRLIYKKVISEAELGKRLHYYDLPDEMKTHKNQHSFTDRYKVHSWNDIPHTIVAHIGKDGHYNIHPDISKPRSLTVREAARIQSFPDNYRFEGPSAAQYTQVGNAVPPLLAEAAAKAIKKCYFHHTD